MDRTKVRALVGDHEKYPNGDAVNGGVPIPVRLSIFAGSANEEKSLFVKETNPVLTSSGDDHFKKEIGFLKLKPGVYRMRLELLNSVTAFGGIPVSVDIYYDKLKRSVN